MGKHIMVAESTLADSIVYKSFNRNSEMTTLLLNAIKKSTPITESHIEEQLYQIDRTRISMLHDDVIKSFKKGDILILHTSIVNFPKAIPFFVTRLQGKVRSIIFINNYGTITKDKTTNREFLNISMKDLYSLMEGAYIGLQHALYPDKFKRSLGLMKVSGAIYTNMILRILNKEYALSIDRVLYSKIAFSIGYFFFKQVWMTTSNDIAFAYAKSYTTNEISVGELVIIQKSYETAGIENIKDLIEFIKEFSPRLSSLNFRYILQVYINTFKGPSILGLECLPYFLFTVESSLLGSFIVNQPIISDITKGISQMNIFYPELIKILS